MRPPSLEEIPRIYFDHPFGFGNIPVSNLIVDYLEKKERREVVTPAKLQKEFESYRQANPNSEATDFWVQQAIACDAMLFMFIPDTPIWQQFNVHNERKRVSSDNRVSADIVRIAEAMWKEGKEVFSIKPEVFSMKKKLFPVNPEDFCVYDMKLWSRVEPILHWSEEAVDLDIEETLTALQAGGWQQREEIADNTPAHKIASGG